MSRCHYCGEEIKTKMFWERFDEDALEWVNVCNDCAEAHVDEFHHWGLVFKFNDEYKKEVSSPTEHTSITKISIINHI